MLAKRIWGGIIIALIGFLLIAGGEWIYTIGISLALAGAAWEYISMFKKGNYAPDNFPVIFGTFAISFLSIIDNFFYPAFTLIITIFAILFHKVIKYKNISQTGALDMTIELSTLVFIALPGSYLILLRMLPNGLYWVMITILPICIADIGAFAIGSMLGKHKLAPVLSPKKTIEGYVGGVFSALLTGIGMHFLFQPHIQSLVLSSSIVISLLAGIASPLGDLAKSIIKRAFALQDTGSLIPGHGGVLDRIDTWLWAAPIGYFIAMLFYI